MIKSMLNTIKQNIKSAFNQTQFNLFIGYALLLSSLFLLSACGFHLRSYGETPSNIHQLALDCPSSSSWELCHHLKQALQLNKIDVNEKSPLILSVSPMEQKSRVLSLQSNASAAELGLFSEVTYRIISAKEDEIKHTQSVHVNNSYRHESSALLAKDRERDELQMQLSQQLADMIVRQISILTIEGETATSNLSSKKGN